MTDGVLCIDKPQNHTSFDVIARLRGILHTRKLGHAGTLDPMATGVLPVFIGRATKACDLLPVQDKRYTAVFQLGVTTDTQDLTGQVLRRRPVDVTAADLSAALASFEGEQWQVPPMYSAVKVGGKRLYDLARQGQEVERPARPVTFLGIRLLERQGERVTIDVACSKGGYIRTLCHDVGEKLGCGAALSQLRRTEAAGYTLADCLTLEEVQRRMETGEALPITPVDRIFRTLPRLELTEKAARLYQNGVKLDGRRLGVAPGTEDLAVYGPQGFLGVSHFESETGELRLRALFALPENPQTRG